MRKGKQLLTYLPLLLCAVFLWGYWLFDLLTPPKEFSEMENRPLAQAPKTSVRGIINNSFSMKYEEYINDQFAGRDEWITLKSVTESALGKLENNGIVYGKDDYMFEKALSIDKNQLYKNLFFIQDFGRKHPDAHLNLTIIPNSYAVLTDKMPKGLHTVDQQEVVQELYQQAAPSGWKTLDIFPVLASHNQEYIFYRTDHHWTTYGAWLGYAAFVNSIGLTPVPLQEMPANEVQGFYGSYYSKAKRFSAKSDTITWYNLPVQQVTIDEKVVPGLYNTEMFNKRDKYAAFLRGNNGLTVIKNPSAQPGKEPSRILLFKDSYGNSFAPFLTNHFDEVYVVDLRHFMRVSQLMEETEFAQIYLLYNFESFATDVHLAKLQL